MLPLPLVVTPAALDTEPFARWMLTGDNVRPEGARMYSEYGMAKAKGANESSLRATEQMVC